MARIRTIKPELARHELLFEAERETGLPLRFAWAMLFTACDREGRFSWRPRALKLDILPYDDVDFSRVLHAWLTRGLLVKYRVGAEWIGWIPTFRKHQNINAKESPSTLPSYEEAEQIEDFRNQVVMDACLTRASPVDDAYPETADSTSGEGEGKGREREREGKKERGAENSSTRPPAEDGSPVFTMMPTNTGQPYPITEAKVAEWEATYPGVDVRQKLRTLRQWSIDNPKRRKTAGGMFRFVSGRLSEEQDRGPRNAANRTNGRGRPLTAPERVDAANGGPGYDVDAPTHAGAVEASDEALRAPVVEQLRRK